MFSSFLCFCLSLLYAPTHSFTFEAGKLSGGSQNQQGQKHSDVPKAQEQTTGTLTPQNQACEGATEDALLAPGGHPLALRPCSCWALLPPTPVAGSFSEPWRASAGSLRGGRRARESAGYSLGILIQCWK